MNMIRLYDHLASKSVNWLPLALCFWIGTAFIGVSVGGELEVIAVDKIGHAILFINPETRKVIHSFPTPARPHVVAILPDGQTAVVPIYGDGIYGNNPNPGHHILVIDLPSRSIRNTIDIAPLKAPHQGVFAVDGRCYITCEDSGVVAIVDIEQRTVLGTITNGSTGCHRMVITRDGKTVFTENEDAGKFVSVLDTEKKDLCRRIALDTSMQGIALSPNDSTLILLTGDGPQLKVIDAKNFKHVSDVRLKNHKQPAQIANFTPDGKYLLVSSFSEPLLTIMRADDLQSQQTLKIGEGPMDMAFHPDGNTVWVANHNEGSISIVSISPFKESHRSAAGKGVETLAFYDRSTFDVRLHSNGK